MRSQSKRTTNRPARAGARPAAGSDTRNRGGSSTTHRPTKSPRNFDSERSLDGERLLRQTFRRGDQFRHSLLGIREDRVAPAEQGEPFLEDREGSIEGQVAAG